MAYGHNSLLAFSSVSSQGRLENSSIARGAATATWFLLRGAVPESELDNRCKTPMICLLQKDGCMVAVKLKVVKIVNKSSCFGELLSKMATSRAML